MDMYYEWMGRLHAELHHLRAAQAARGEEGQGTVEYVALSLLVAALLGAVVAASHKAGGAGIADAVAKKLKTTIDGVGAK